MTIAPPAPQREARASAAPPEAVPVPASGVGRRLLAYVVDLAVVTVPAAAAWYLTSSVVLAAVVGAELALALVVWEARSGRTVGKQLLGIRAAQVERPYAPGLGRELVRAALLALAHLVAGVGQLVLIVSAAGDRSRLGRGWHDRVARTRVVDVRPGVRVVAPAPPVRPAAPRPAALPPMPGAAQAPQPAPQAQRGPGVPGIPQAPARALQAGLPFPTPAPHETTSGQEARRIAADFLGRQEAASAGSFVGRLDGAQPPGAPTPPAIPPVPAQPPQPTSGRPPVPPTAPTPAVAPPAAPPRPAAAPPPQPSAAPPVSAPPPTVQLPAVPAVPVATPPPPPPPAAPQPPSAPDDASDDALTVVYVLTLDSGRTITITGSGVLGRRPQPRAGESVDHVIEVEDPSRSLSRTHIRFGVADGAFWVEDAGSANGTRVEAPDGSTTQVRGGSRVQVMSGGEIHLGERTISVERWQA